MIESPCMAICRQENGVCVGCGRTQDEVIRWWDMSDEEKQAVIERISNDNSIRFSS